MKMPRQSAEDEITALRTEHERLTPIIEAHAATLIEMDAARKPISDAFSTAWARRDNIERRLFFLERKIKVITPRKGENYKPKEKDASALIKKLTPAQLERLKAILTAGAGAQKGGA
jgi:hypothetical protein